MTETAQRPAPDAQQPPPRRGLPDIPGPIETAAAAWRALRRMSSALILLFSVAAASVIATVVPQAPVTARAVRQWREGTAGPGRAVARVLDAAGLFDIFGSWWFMLLLALLFISLTACLIPRYRAFFKVARRPPAVGRNFDRLSNSTTFTTALPVDDAVAAAHAAVRKRRFRTRQVDSGGGQQVAAERGHWREGGSLIFHTAFYVLLAGAVIGKTFGFTGQIGLVEGQSFADTRIAYDFADPGRAFGLDDHRGFVMTLDDFDVSYFPDFTPRDFVGSVTISENGEPVRSSDIRVNRPLRYDGMTIYQLAFGMAPRITVRAGDRVLFDEQVRLAPNTNLNLYSGTAKVKFDDPDQQIALDMVLAPSATLDAEGSPTIGPDPRPTNPVLVANLYFGALGLDRPVPASDFIRGDGPVDTAMLRPGGAADLAQGNLTVEFGDLSYWSGFQVTHAPARWLLLVGGILVLVGLLPSLYSYRRRIWVDVQPAADGATVTVAGVALQRKDAFSDEFASISESVHRAVDGAFRTNRSR